MGKSPVLRGDGSVTIDKRAHSQGLSQRSDKATKSAYCFAVVNGTPAVDLLIFLVPFVTERHTQILTFVSLPPAHTHTHSKRWVHYTHTHTHKYTLTHQTR